MDGNTMFESVMLFMKSARKRGMRIAAPWCAVLVLIIAAAAAAGCMNNRDKRYYCTDDRFSISFPATWNITENIKGTRILAEIPAGEGIPIIKQNVNVVVEELSTPLSLKEYVELQTGNLKKLKGIKILKQGETAIGGNPAAWFAYSFTIHDFGYQALVYTVNKQNRFYVITGISQINNYYAYEDRFRHIANSFRLE